ncbi:MAG TPA: DinB family protein [Spirochaetia bacterium]|nr:DinB family protein [Spirochaetia bacterium]
MKEALARLLGHLEWANGFVLESLRGGEEPSARVMKLFAHVVGAERVWLSRISQEPPPAPPVWPDLTLEECTRLAAENAASLRRLLDSSDDAQLERGVTYTNSRGERFTSKIDDILLHVCMHGSYHRGQIAAQRRAEAREPVNTDYITWVRSWRGKGTS